MKKKLISIVMLGMLMLAGCSGAKSTKKTEKDPYEVIKQDDDVIAEPIPEQGETTEETEETAKEIIEEIIEPEEEAAEEEVSEQTIRPEVKEAIDAYEKFIDEYIAFMEKYEESDGSDLGMLMEYMTFISDLEEYLEKMDDLENDLTDAESWYFLEVMNRCNEKIYKYGN